MLLDFYCVYRRKDTAVVRALERGLSGFDVDKPEERYLRTNDDLSTSGDNELRAFDSLEDCDRARQRNDLRACVHTILLLSTCEGSEAVGVEGAYIVQKLRLRNREQVGTIIVDK